MTAVLRTGALKPTTCAAPGRLDFIGGIADYSGSLVLEMPTQVRTSVTLTPEKAGSARFISSSHGNVTLDLAPLCDLIRREVPPLEFRAHLDEIALPRWARYPLGCWIVLTQQTRWIPDSGFLLQISSTVPDSHGVSSSAALEIATLRTLNQAAGLGLSDLEIARLGQQAENLIVGASCGLMDQLASSCGKPGELLPILCRPDTLLEPVRLPEGLMIVGWPSGVKHQVVGSPYAAARAAAFMGKRILETLCHRQWAYTSEIPPELFRRFECALPTSMTGSEFLLQYKDTHDPLTQLNPVQSYPVRAATRFPIEENARAHQTRELLSQYDANPHASAQELRAALRDSHYGYGAIGLGSAQTDAFLERLLEESTESGLIGGRISGGGSGGTVVILLEKRAEKTLEAMAVKNFYGKIIF